MIAELCQHGLVGIVRQGVADREAEQSKYFRQEMLARIYDRFHTGYTLTCVVEAQKS